MPLPLDKRRELGLQQEEALAEGEISKKKENSIV